MQNPELLSFRNNLPIDTMYEYSTGKNVKWGNHEYKTPRQYLDPIDQVLQRKYLQPKKGQKDRKYFTKRGHYMQYELKIAKSIPSSVDHGKNQPWSVQNLEKIAKHRKIDPKLIKNTYLEQIQINQQKRKVPGISTYSLQKSIQQKEKQIEKEKERKKVQEQRRFFYQDTDYLANASPGSGNYNPHEEVQKIMKQKTDWKHWVEKHKKFEQILIKRDSIKPSSCSYKPMNMTISTFDRISLSPKGKSKVQSFGNSARFPYQMPDKKKVKQVRPSPAHYKTGLEWANKNESPKFKAWNSTVWKGRNHSTISVYN